MQAQTELESTLSTELNWANDPLWYKDAIIYQLHVKAFGDSNHDGIGDFRGLIQRLDYVQDLGVNTLWLLPFYPSPMRDDGYDIADYRNIYPEYGTRADFKAFVREAHRRGLKVVTELVINHTSDQHPWFQAARSAPPGSAKRNFYVWNDDDKKFPETRIIFTDTETSNWAWDPVAKAYYWHRFFSHQPDLNHDNPEVVKAVIRLMRFWLDMGVDGLRLDAIPYLCVQEGTYNENLPATHNVLRQMRAAVDEHYQYRMFLAEANQWPEDVRDYFGDEDECHMCYHFPLMPRMYMSVAMEDRHPIVDIMEQTPDIPESCQWAVFLRNHDELTLEMVTDQERDYMYKAYAADPRMRVNVGIRRRLAPLMDNDIDKIKLMNSMLMSMPGSPIVYYGDEIGMGDNIYLGDRNGVRTPMQWSPDRNAGFSKADPQKLYLPPIMDPIYGYEAVNVESQHRDPSSLLNWMKRLIAVRKAHQAFGRGSLNFIKPGNRKILAYTRELGEEAFLCVANLSRTAQPVELDLARFKGRVPLEMLGQTPFPPIGDLPYLLTLPRYGFYWFNLNSAEAPAWHDERLPAAEPPVLVLFQGWQSFFPALVESGRKAMAQKLHDRLTNEVLPNFLATQRWFAAKGETIDNMEITVPAFWKERGGDWLLARLSVRIAGGATQEYSLPLALAWEKDGEEHIHGLGAHALVKVRSRAHMGVLYDAFADPSFTRAIVAFTARKKTVELGEGKLKFSPTKAFADLCGEEKPEELPVRLLSMGSSNTIIMLGEQLFLKGYRRLRPGKNPELEMGRFLTETSPFANIVPLAGTLEYESEDGTPYSLAMLQGFVANQGDAWNYTQDNLKRFLEEYLLQPETMEEQCEETQAVFLMMMSTLGLRTGELHRALAKQTGDPAFDPEPISGDDLDAWFQQTLTEAAQTLDKLAQQRDHLSEALQTLADRLIAAREHVLERIASLKPVDLQAVKIRYHGDYHLGQVLVSKNDFIIIDFEGEPARTLEERRSKHSPLKDVAGMLRSFNYAGYAALSFATADRPADLPLLEPIVRDWEQRTIEAFLDGYGEAIADCPVYPAEPTSARALIDLFLLEKAFYELRYELDNRPDWVKVPLGGLAELLLED
ncbi:MAG: maltose alpha-D-glucosyltransferase [Candidatus Competibacteraceae bacterium]|jgi:maltose alpha-D-glucosyltransferase/alpha-amylase|nr:maltose alpha-D-glucosyltransferase [Candidatus Competibacteraceae bacterium]